MIPTFPQPKDKRATLKSKDNLTTIPIDMYEELATSYNAITTENDIEFGSDVTDHVKNEPTEINIVGFISERPPDDLTTMLKGTIGSFLINEITGRLNPLSGPLSALALATAAQFIDEAPERIRSFINAVLELRETRQPFDFATEVTIYRDVVITNFSPKYDLGSGLGVVFTMTLKEIVIIQPETVTIDVRRTGGDRNQAAKESSQGNLGNQQLSGAGASSTEKAQSVLTKISNSIGEFGANLLELVN